MKLNDFEIESGIESDSSSDRHITINKDSLLATNNAISNNDGPVIASSPFHKGTY